jgi:hypothetical protein
MRPKFSDATQRGPGFWCGPQDFFVWLGARAETEARTLLWETERGPGYWPVGHKPGDALNTPAFGPEHAALIIALDTLCDAPDIERWLAFVQRNPEVGL